MSHDPTPNPAPTAPTIAYHLTPADRWHAADAAEPFRSPSLETEGFIHLTHRPDDLVAVANAFYRDEPGEHVVLTVALGVLSSPWRYDGDLRFPHVYGPLDRVAILSVVGIDRDADGWYLPFAGDRRDLRRDSQRD